MTRQTYFIADLHLSENRPDISAAFFDFLNTHILNKDVDALYILGDFFEVWVGDDYITALSADVAEHLSAVNDGGTPVYFIHGNRDFIMRKQYADMAAMTLLDELMLAMPLWYRKKIARNAREKSKLSQADKPIEILDVVDEAVLATFAKHNVTNMIHGHTHRPNVHTYKVNEQTLTRTVLGDWYTQGSYLVVTPQSQELISTPFA